MGMWQGMPYMPGVLFLCLSDLGTIAGEGSWLRYMKDKVGLQGSTSEGLDSP